MCFGVWGSGVCGIFGTLAVAFFSEAAPFGIQLVGTLSVGVFAFVFSFMTEYPFALPFITAFI